MSKNFNYQRYYEEVTSLKPFLEYYSDIGFRSEMKRFFAIKNLLKEEWRSSKFLKLVDGCKGFYNGELTGIDIANTTLMELKEILKKNGIRCNLVQSDIRKIPFPDNNFDIVICSQVLEHLEDPKEAVLEIRRILKNKGIAVITVPFEDKIQYTICTHCYRKTPLYGHFHSFTKEKIKDLFEKGSFEILSVKLVRSVLPIKFYDYLLYFIWSPLDIFFQRLIGRKPNWIVIKVKKKSD
ncbi:MAG: class I SAM-dependent methyltransferase [Candidatus Hydrogenedens sp.]